MIFVKLLSTCIYQEAVVQKHQTLSRTELFDLNHDLNHSKIIIDLWFFISDFLITDLYEFNTNNCLQESRSTKFFVCLSYFLSECSEATQTCLPEEVSFQVRSFEST